MTIAFRLIEDRAFKDLSFKFTSYTSPRLTFMTHERDSSNSAFEINCPKYSFS